MSYKIVAAIHRFATSQGLGKIKFPLFLNEPEFFFKMSDQDFYRVLLKTGGITPLKR